MARVLGSAIGELRGKLGGQVFSRNASGAYVRTYAKPVNPNTQMQNEARGRFSSSVALWKSLNAGQQSSWNEYADGNSTYDSGFNAFVSLNNQNSTLLNPNLLLSSITLDGDEILTYGTRQAVLSPPSADFFPPAILEPLPFEGELMGDELNLTAVFGITTPPSPSGGGFFADFTDSSIAFFMSQTADKLTSFVKEDVVFLGASKMIEAPVSYTPGAPSSTLQVGTTRNFQNSRNFPNLGQYAKINAYWVDKLGRKILIGQQPIEIQAST